MYAIKKYISLSGFKTCIYILDYRALVVLTKLLIILFCVFLLFWPSHSFPQLSLTFLSLFLFAWIFHVRQSHTQTKMEKIT